MPVSPTVSVVMPVYNGANYLRQALESVLNQTHPPLEIIVVNDGSTDETNALVRELARSNPSLKLLEQSNRGLAMARNAGMEEAQGEYIALLDHDDRWLPRYLEQMLRYAQPRQLTFSEFQLIDEAGHVIKAQRKLRAAEMRLPEILVGKQAAPSGVLFGREVWEEVGPMDPELRGTEDWDWFIRVALTGIPSRLVPRALWQYRVHSASMSHNSKLMVESTLKTLDKTFSRPDFPPALRPFQNHALYLNFVTAAAKMYALGDPETARNYLDKARQNGPQEYFSPQTFISFLKLYAQVTGSNLAATGEIMAARVVETGQNRSEQARLAALAHLSLAFLLVRRPRYSIPLVARAFLRYPALPLLPGIYRTFYRYVRLFTGEVFYRLRFKN